MNLIAHLGPLAIVKILPTKEIPSWATSGTIFSITRTPDEISIVCDDLQVPSNILAERGWSYFQVQGQLDFGLTGVIASLAMPLAKSDISIFVISTFNTDYILVKSEKFEFAKEILRTAGYIIL